MNTARVNQAFKIVAASNRTTTEKHALDIQVDLIHDRIQAGTANDSDLEHLEDIIAELDFERVEIEIEESGIDIEQEINIMRDACLETKLIEHAYEHNEIDFPYCAADLPKEVLEASKKALGIENVSFLTQPEIYDAEQCDLF